MKRVASGERHVATREETELRNCKVRITMYLDADIVESFKQRASGANTAPYQTQINQALREFLAGSKQAGDYSHLAEDPAFLDAVVRGVRRRLSA